MLSSTEAESRSVSQLLDLEADARERFEALRLGYMEVPGAPLLCEAISAIYQSISSQDVRSSCEAELRAIRTRLFDTFL